MSKYIKKYDPKELLGKIEDAINRKEAIVVLIEDSSAAALDRLIDSQKKSSYWIPYVIGLPVNVAEDLLIKVADKIAAERTIDSANRLLGNNDNTRNDNGKEE